MTRNDCERGRLKREPDTDAAEAFAVRAHQEYWLTEHHDDPL